jgi:1-acyl-sn-glycerol-3-phosphate acyltransferase
MMRIIYGFLLKYWLGFKVTRPENAFLSKKRIFAIAPHTSNWDFPLGLCVRGAIGLKVQFIAKHTLFRFPFGYIFRSWGGIPVDRSKTKNFVDATVQALSNYDEVSLALAPEGTRSYIKDLKTGFYWIARNGGWPLILVKFDWQNKVVDFSPEFQFTDDPQSDIGTIKEYFRGTLGKIPSQSYTSEEEDMIEKTTTSI